MILENLSAVDEVWIDTEGRQTERQTDNPHSTSTDIEVERNDVFR